MAYRVFVNRYLKWRWGSYDILYQNWLSAKRKGKYRRADKLRTLFEKWHGLTIIREGEMVMEGNPKNPNVTVNRMTNYQWQKKYGDYELGLIMERDASRFGKVPDEGYHS